MGRTIASPHRGHAHEQHLLLVRQCSRCARWIVLRGWTNHVAAFNNQGAARAAAARLLRDLARNPDPDPICIEITVEGSAVATGLPPVEPVEAPAAA